jgi:hypothetical protein
MKRNCGYLPDNAEASKRVVWARKNTSTTSCPRSYVSADSLGWMEEFQAWKLFGCSDVARMPARTVEAFSVLERELVEEKANGQ